MPCIYTPLYYSCNSHIICTHLFCSLAVIASYLECGQYYYCNCILDKLKQFMANNFPNTMLNIYICITQILSSRVEALQFSMEICCHKQVTPLAYTEGSPVLIHISYTVQGRTLAAFRYYNFPNCIFTSPPLFCIKAQTVQLHHLTLKRYILQLPPQSTSPRKAPSRLVAVVLDFARRLICGTQDSDQDNALRKRMSTAVV